MITITNKRACIEGVEKLLNVEDNRMCFLLKNKRLTIIGSALRVVMYTVEEIWIDGMINQVIFDEK